MNAVKNRRTMADTLLHPCGSYAPCRRVEGSRVRFLYLDSSRPATRLQEPRAYPELFAVVGSQVPDLRGLFLRGHGSQVHSQNNGSTVGITSTTHSSGTLGQVQGDALRPVPSGGIHHFGSSGGGAFETRGYSDQRGSNGGGSMMTRLDTSRVVPTANENRPVNTAVRYLIRARP